MSTVSPSSSTKVTVISHNPSALSFWKNAEIMTSDLWVMSLDYSAKNSNATLSLRLTVFYTYLPSSVMRILL